MAIKRYVGIGGESVYGTPVAASIHSEAVASFKPDQGWIIPPPVASREFRKKNLGPWRNRGSIGDFPVDPNGIIGYLAFGVLGSGSTTNPTPGVYKHQFRPADILPSLTVRRGVELNELISPGCLVEALTIRIPHDNDVQARAEIYSGFLESKASLGTPTISALQAFNMLGYATSTLNIAGVSKKDVVYDLEVTIKNNIPFQRGDLSGRTFAKRRCGQREITGKVSIFFDDTTEYDRFIAGTEFALAFQVNGPDIVASYPYLFYMNLPKCIYLRETNPDITPISEPLVVEAPFKAFYDSSSGYDAAIDLQNTITGY